MAVALKATIQRFIGLSTDPKPTACPVGSTFYEYDTKLTYVTYDKGTNWTALALGYGLVFAGTCNVGMTASTTSIVCADLAGYGDSYFGQQTVDAKSKVWYLQVIKDTNSLGSALTGQVQRIKAYTSATGTFTTDAFTANVEASDEILILHESIAMIGRDDADNEISSATVVADEDGSIVERLEWIQVAIGGTAMQLRVQQSAAADVEENNYQQFNISLLDMDAGAIASADIDITGISVEMAQSRGGAAFSAVGITQPTFAKGDGRVYSSYQFLAAEWVVGDVYRLTVSGITCTVQGDTAYVPIMVWSNLIGEAEDVKIAVDAIRTNVGEMNATATADSLADIATTSVMAKLGRLLLRFSSNAFSSTVNGSARTDIENMVDGLASYLVAAGAAFSTTINGTARTAVVTAFDGLASYLVAAGAAFSTTIGGAAKTTVVTAFDGLAAYFVAAGAAFSSTINGVARTSVVTAFDGIASYITASGAAFSKKVNNLTQRTNLEDIIQDICAVIGCDGANAFSTTLAGSARTTIEAAFDGVHAEVGYEGATALADKLTAARAGYLDELATQKGATGVFHEQADTAVNVNAILASETTVLDLSVASTRYIVRHLRLKCVDPVAQTVMVRLYELVNDFQIAVQTFAITTANASIYHSLVDMFGLNQLVGDNLKVTVQATDAGPYAVTGQYSHAKTNV